MDIFPIWQSTYYVSSADSVKYRIKKAGQEICSATAVRLPDEDDIRIGLNKPCQNYVDSIIDMDATGDTPSNAYAEFSLEIYNASNHSWFEAYQFAFVNDWSYGAHDLEGGYSEPINGHAAPGQLITYSVCCTGTTAETICYDEYDHTPHISVTPSAITFTYVGGNTNVLVFANCDWEIVSITGGFHVNQTSGQEGSTTITITADNYNVPTYKDGKITFRARNLYGTATAELNIRQTAAPAYLNVTSGDGESFDGLPNTWTVTYDTNLDVVYYKFTDGVNETTGETSGGSVSFDVSGGDSSTTYTVEFYRWPFFDYLDNASATVAPMPVSIDVTPPSMTFFGAGTANVSVFSTFDWTATVPQGLTLSQTTGHSGTTVVTVTFGDTQAQTADTITFSTTHNGYTASDTFVLNRFPADYTGFTGEYLTLEFLEDSDFSMVVRTGSYITGWRPSVSASTDNGTTWTPLTFSGGSYRTTKHVQAGDKLMLKGNNSAMAKGNPIETPINSTVFETTGKCIVYGDMMSLIGNSTMSDYTFPYLFVDTKVVNAAGLVLPRRIKYYGCYHLFTGNEYLEVPPAQIIATKVDMFGLTEAFYGCTSLESAPLINIQDAYAGYAMSAMFQYDTGITSATVYVEQVLNNDTIENMFRGCTNLTYLAFPNLIPPSGMHDTFIVFNGSPTGTFVKHPDAVWNRGIRDIPEGWTVINA